MLWAELYADMLQLIDDMTRQDSQLIECSRTRTCGTSMQPKTLQAKAAGIQIQPA